MSEGSVTYWIHKLQTGDAQAVQKLWEDYFPRMVGLARARLRDTPRGAADEEDVALSAFDSFHRAAAAGRFPRLLDRHDLWQLLVLLTARKAINLYRHERRDRRGGDRVRHLSALPGGEEGEAGEFFSGLVSREPDPAFAALLADEFRQRLASLDDPVLHAVAVGKLEGQTHAEIAARLGRSEKTVERKLELIRALWEQEASP
jgi:DNA-directed RNA polymerase specialized sigma24 family protein